MTASTDESSVDAPSTDESSMGAQSDNTGAVVGGVSGGPGSSDCSDCSDGDLPIVLGYKRGGKM